MVILNRLIKNINRDIFISKKYLQFGRDNLATVFKSKINQRFFTTIGLGLISVTGMNLFLIIDRKQNKF